MEKVKRETISAATLRKLYIVSGNRCAFPGCNHEIVDENGTLVAELCHIEAAMPGGERFNPDMTNKDRAKAENLLYLCHKHHKITDDVNKYTVNEMLKIKRDHENLFRNIMDDMLKTIEDVTKQQRLIKSNSLQSINDVLEWNLDDSYLKESVDSYNKVFEVLNKLDRNTRTVFSYLVEESELAHTRVVLLTLVQKKLNLNVSQMNNYLDILNKYNLISRPYEDYDCGYLGPISDIIDPNDYDIWGDIKKYCNLKEISLTELIVELDFQKLD